MSVLGFCARHLGFTWGLGFGGMALAAVGQQRLAGLAWLMLGSGAVGAALARATNGKELMPANVRRDLSEEEVSFLVGHLPFLALGLLALAMAEDDDER